ncbi:Eco57I restriction-modification methylase domain-containing protein, partial [Cetobacterium sp.]
SALQEKLFEDIINKIREKVLKISILDNAMGSGHFLVNAAYHIAAKVFNFLHENIQFETLEDKEMGEYNYWIRMAVTHNIYGVDINKLAVQLGKLSLWLISATKDKPLSFIDHHLKYGNSLIGTSRESIDNTLGDNIGKNQNRRLFDVTINNLMSYVDAQFKTLEKMPEETADQIHEKEKFYYEDIQGHLKAIKTKWDIYLAMQINDKKGIVKKEIYDQIVNTNLEILEESYPNFKDFIEQAKENQFFHWELEFPEVFSGNNKGFDCVIGNPPYVRVQNLNPIIVDWYKKLKRTAYKRVDVSILFFEEANSLLKIDGKLGYISSNQFLITEYGGKLRKFLRTNYQIKEMIDFGDLEVFKKLSTYVSIFLLKKSEPQNFIYKKITELKNINKLSEIDGIEIEINNLSDDSWSLVDKTEIKLLKKLEKFPKLVEKAKAWTGIISGLDSVYIMDLNDINENRIEKELMLPLLRGKDPKRYEVCQNSKFILYPYKENNGKTELLTEKELKLFYPNTYQYLLKNEIELKKRKDSRKTYENKKDWYGLVRFSKKSTFDKIKIVTSGEVKNNKFCLDLNKSGFSCARVCAITSENQEVDIYYLLGILNSKLIEYFLHKISPLKQGGYYQYSSTNLDLCPIVNISLKDQEIIIENVKKILEYKKEKKETREIEEKIDEIVYSFYGITLEERKIIEKNTISIK